MRCIVIEVCDVVVNSGSSEKIVSKGVVKAMGLEWRNILNLTGWVG